MQDQKQRAKAILFPACMFYMTSMTLLMCHISLQIHSLQCGKVQQGKPFDKSSIIALTLQLLIRKQIYPYFRNLSNLNFRAKIFHLPLFYGVHKLSGRWPSNLFKF